jgi:hypothetical protein
MLGMFQVNPKTRAEFMNLIASGNNSSM